MKHVAWRTEMEEAWSKMFSQRKWWATAVRRRCRCRIEGPASGSSIVAGRGRRSGPGRPGGRKGVWCWPRESVHTVVWEARRCWSRES
eukprot:123901-Pleurochrysis_carterae.AAC.1